MLLIIYSGNVVCWTKSQFESVLLTCACVCFSLSLPSFLRVFPHIRIDNQGLCATLRIQFCHTTSTDHFTDCNTPNKSALKSTYRFDSCVTSNAKHNSIHIYSSWQRTAAAAASLLDWFHEICVVHQFHTLNKRTNEYSEIIANFNGNILCWIVFVSLWLKFVYEFIELSWAYSQIHLEVLT